MKPWDVVVVGAGSAGSAAALHTARRGLRTLVVERRALADAGAHWVNSIYGGAFEESQIARPEAPELRGSGHRFHMVAGWGPVSISMAANDVLDLDMSLLIARLRRDAASAGAVFVERAPVAAIAPGRVTLADGVVHEATVVVDATGLGGLYRTEKPRPADICAAAQGIYAITDPAAARAFFATFGAEPGDTLGFTAVAGGYSIVAVRIEGDELSVLSGSLPALGHPSGRALRDAFVARHGAWVGALRFGGQAPIPLQRPRRHLAHVDGRGAEARAVVWIGDAASQVYAAHGSGIGAQLVAARMLGEALAARGAAGAAAWQRAWHRRFGASFVAADAFRRLSMRLGPRGLAFMLKAGLLRASMVRLGMSAGL
ncbi:MAG: FAD-dependent oxidoreductase [Myxococcota bacterium]